MMQIIVRLITVMSVLFWINGCGGGSSSNPITNTPDSVTQLSESDAILANAYSNKISDIQVRGSGTITKLLADDTSGSQHQRFILKLSSGQTLLVTHNIDLAPSIDTLAVGDSIEFYGEYVWNDEGGIIHWTHADPNGIHVAGWLKHNGIIYQ